MKYICNHANTEHCKKVQEYNHVNCQHNEMHESTDDCWMISICLNELNIINVKCIEVKDL
jgi:hypothetical protein